MEFNTQICTTKEQSERLLALGLKKETADCRWMAVTKDSKGNEIPAKKQTWFLRLSSEEYYQSVGFSRTSFIPAWSLHRLIALLSGCSKYANWALDEITYENMIGMIETNISRGRINLKYLEEQQ